MTSFDEDPREEFYAPSHELRRMSFGSSFGLDDEDLRREYAILTELFTHWEAIASHPGKVNSEECLRLQVNRRIGASVEHSV